ncbi:MAG: hypothetical protein ABEH56_04750 [Salinirussus sp.]
MVVDAVVETFGPFLIPVVVFVVGGIGYGVLWLLTRWGVLPSREG